MQPITMLRNALGREEGGSGVPLDRDAYARRFVPCPEFGFEFACLQVRMLHFCRSVRPWLRVCCFNCFHLILCACLVRHAVWRTGRRMRQSWQVSGRTGSEMPDERCTRLRHHRSSGKGGGEMPLGTEQCASMVGPQPICGVNGLQAASTPIQTPTSCPPSPFPAKQTRKVAMGCNVS